MLTGLEGRVLENTTVWCFPATPLRPQAGKSRFQSSGQQVNRPALFLSKTKTGLEGELDERARWAKKRGRASDKTRSIVTRERARRLCFGGTSRDTARRRASPVSKALDSRSTDLLFFYLRLKRGLKGSSMSAPGGRRSEVERVTKQGVSRRGSERDDYVLEGRAATPHVFLSPSPTVPSGRCGEGSSRPNGGWNLKRRVESSRFKFRGSTVGHGENP